MPCVVPGLRPGAGAPKGITSLSGPRCPRECGRVLYFGTNPNSSPDTCRRIPDAAQSQGSRTMAQEGIRANGQLIRRLREGRGWTQEDLARRVGCVKRTIENAEAGKPISIRIRSELAQALEVRPDDLRL